MKSKQGRTVRQSILLTLLFTFIASGGLSQQAAAGSFCPPSKVREYSPPLKGMHSVSQPPYAKQLPFGPADIEILPVGFSHIAVEGGQIGFYMDGPLKDPQDLGWDVDTRLSVVDRQGRVKKIEVRRHEQFGVVKELSVVKLAFNVGRTPKFYRVDATFRDSSGSKLAHYADYFRVMPREADVRLGLSAATYQAGKVLLMRLEDLGTVGISFGLEFALDVWDGSSWTASPGAPLAWEQIGLGLGAGRTQQCQRFPLPEDLAPGRYRLTKFFSTSLGGPFSHVARAFFDVTA